MLKRLSFVQALVAIFALTFIVGFATFVWSGATTDKGTPNAIRAERAIIMSAERARCRHFGTYSSIATLRSEGLLAFKPIYNSVVYLPGTHCGTIIIGSPSFQSPVN